MSVTAAPTAEQTPDPTNCATCSDNSDDSGSSTTYIEYTTTYSWSSANWILSATQPVCTWQYHCLGDTCKTSDDCDHDWECRQSICQPCCYPQHSGLPTKAVIGIGVGVPGFVAVLTAIVFLLWRGRRKKKRRQQVFPRDLSEDFGKPELEAPGVPLKDRSKSVEMEHSSHPRAELGDNAEVAVEADSMEPTELEDTSVLGQQKYHAMQLSEPPKAMDDIEEVREIIGMYEISSPVGVLPSPSLQARSQPHSPSPPPDWPLPRSLPQSSHSRNRSPPRSPYSRDRSPPRSTYSRNRSPPRSPRSYNRSPPRSPSSGNFLLSPEPATVSVNTRSSPVSDVSSRTATDSHSHRLSPRSPARILPYGMIDRFDEDDDEDIHPESSASYHGSSYHSVEERDRPPDGRSGQDSSRYRWSPLPPEEYH